MNSKTKIFFTLFGGVAVVILFFVLGFTPLVSNLKIINAELSSKKTELAKLDKQIREYDSAKSDLARATFQQDIYSTVVIREDLAVVIEQLETAANNTGTTESIQIMEPEKDSGEPAQPAIFEGLALSTEVPYMLTLKSNFADLVNFMEYLEHLPNFTEFKRITLTSVVENIPSEQGGGTINTGDVIGSFDGVFLVKKGAGDEN